MENINGSVQYAQEIVDAFDALARTANENYQAAYTEENTGMENKNAADDGDVQFGMEGKNVDYFSNIIPATREESALIDATDDRNIARLIIETNKTIDGTLHSGSMVLIGKPPDVIKRYTKSENLLYIPQKGVKKAILPKENGGKHGLGYIVIYDLQRIVLSELSRAQFSDLISVDREKFAYNSDVLTVAHVYDLVKNKDKMFKPKKASKIVGEDGTPRVVYHATDAKDIRVFQSGNYAGIIYFGFTPEEAKNAARGKKYVREYYLSAKNPVNTMETPLNWYDAENSSNVNKWKSEGYDSVFVSDEAGISIAVFSPEQIKSATDNIGTFDKSNPDVNYQIRGSNISDRDILRMAAENVERFGKLGAAERDALKNRRNTGCVPPVFLAHTGRIW